MDPAKTLKGEMKSSLKGERDQKSNRISIKLFIYDFVGIHSTSFI